MVIGCVERRKPAAPGEEPPPILQAAPSKNAGDYARDLSTAPARAAAVVDIVSIQKAVTQFEAMEGRLPASIGELLDKRYLLQIPPVPRGKQIHYDPVTGTVTLVAQ